MPQLGQSLRVAFPVLRHSGQPTEKFPHAWAVLEWLEGTDAWTSRHDLLDPHSDDLAIDVAQVVSAIRAVVVDVPVRAAGERGAHSVPFLVVLNIG